MKSVFKKYRAHWSALFFAIGVTAFIIVMPWQSMVERTLKSFLETQGAKNIELTLSNIGFQSLTAKKVKMGQESPFVLNDITIGYSLRDLWKGRVSNLLLSGVDVEVKQEGDQWKLSGFENQPKEAQPSAPFTFPVTVDEVAHLPLDKASLTNSRLNLKSPDWQVDLPLELTWEKEPVAKLTGVSKDVLFKAGALRVSIGEIAAQLSLYADDKEWRGPWSFRGAKIDGAGTAMPDMDGSGALSVQADHAKIQGKAESADRAVVASFGVDYFFQSPEKSALTLANMSMPWMGGTLSVEQVRIPFGARGPLTIHLNLSQVSIQNLLQQLTGKETTATGSISGMIPVTINPNGGIVIHKGSLKANKAGVITLPPEAIPGDHEKVAFVREVLKNLHYTELSILTNNEKDDKLSVSLAVAGHNPDVLSGRAVKINVHLKGDMLEFLQQNLKWLSDPQTLLERGKNEKQ